MPERLTLQAVFDKVWDWNQIQKKPWSGVNTGLTCQYFNPYNTDHRCFIGCAVSKAEAEYLETNHKNKRITSIFLDDRMVVGIFVEDIDVKALGNLQSIHDSPPDHDGDWNESANPLLRQFAERYDLTIPA